MSIIEDLIEFAQPRQKGIKTNFRVSKKYLIKNYPNIFKINNTTKKFEIINFDEAEKIMFNYWIPYLTRNGDITIKNYQTKQGYINRMFYQKKEPKPFKIIKKKFDNNVKVIEYLNNNKDEKIKYKIEYLKKFVNDEILKKLNDCQLYQILNKYIHTIECD